MDLTIAKLAREGDVGVETVRYYQRRGLLETPERTDGLALGRGVRHYREADVRRLRFIRAAQAAGFTLEQIGELIALDSTDDRARARSLAQERIVALDARIAELERARRALRRLARDCASSAAGPCPIITAFENA
jgi:MerR family mercuric resistance operon transcriptional regulator